MEISLVRHGESLHFEKTKLTCNEFSNWIHSYDNAGVVDSGKYPSETKDKIAKAGLVLTSDLKRSMDSAMLLGSVNIVTDSLFRETELPTNVKFFRTSLKLNPNTWAFILRCLWFTGYSDGCESLYHAKIRADKAATKLVKFAEQHQPLVLVGHGFFNMLIAKNLQKMGFEGKRRTNSKHWAITTYTLTKTKGANAR